MDNKKYQNLLKSSIFKNLSLLVSGTLIAQIIVIVFQLFLRRLYSPADFGAFAVYMSVLGILTTITSIRYEQTIILPSEQSKGLGLLELSIWLSLFTSIVFGLLILVFNSFIIRWVDFPQQYIHWLYFLPLSIFIFSVSQALNFYLIRLKRYKLSASNKVVRRASEGIVQSTFGLLSKSFGLVIGDFVGQLAVVIQIGSKIKTDLTTSVSWANMKLLAKQYKNFPLKNGIPSLMNALSLLLPVIIINRQFSEDITGYFDLARTVLIIPLSLITASLSQVLLQQFAEMRNQKKSIKNQVWVTFISLSVISIVFGLIIQFFGVQLFQLIFGNQWDNSGLYASILVWAFALKFIVSPFNIVFTAFERIGIFSIWQAFYFGLILLLNWIPFACIEDFLWTYVVIELVSYLIAGILDAGLIIKYENNLRKN